MSELKRKKNRKSAQIQELKHYTPNTVFLITKLQNLLGTNPKKYKIRD